MNFPYVCWNALQHVGFVSLHELLSRCHGGRWPEDQVLLLLSRLSFTAYEILKALQMGLELWETLECFISEESGTVTWRALELWPLLGAWMLSDCVERTERHCFDFTRATRIQPCYRAAKESMTTCSSAKHLKEKSQDPQPWKWRPADGYGTINPTLPMLQVIRLFQKEGSAGF